MKKYILYILVLAIVLIIDYFNFPNYMGIKSDNFNLDFINLIVLILIFIFTYSFLDKRKIEKERNKNKMTKLIMHNSYKECIENINIITDEIMNKYIIPNTNFYKLKGEDENVRINNIHKHPFNNESMLNHLLGEGQVDINRFKKYIEIKNDYEGYFNLRILFYDNPNLYNPTKERCLKNIEKEIESLENSNAKY